MTWKVRIIKGGELSGAQFRETFVPGREYTYGKSDKKYVDDVLRKEGRLQITEVPAPKAPAKGASAHAAKA